MATLRFLATGRTLEDLKSSCRIAPQTLDEIIPDTCEAIFKAQRNYCESLGDNIFLRLNDFALPLGLEFHDMSNNGEGMGKRWGEFEHRWNFPNCIGAVDGKYVATMLPPGSGSYIYDYKNFHSQVSDLSKKLEDGSLNLPKEVIIAGKNMRCVLVVDVAFPLREYIAKTVRFGVIQTYISSIDFTQVHHIVVVCCALHNFLRSKVPHQYTPLECLDEEEIESGNVTPGPRCNESMSLSKTTCHPTNSAELVRESFVRYFNNEGQVSLATK
ncbi:hypothetical protein PR048_019253, partial [Dryococelus australis]